MDGLKQKYNVQLSQYVKAVGWIDKNAKGLNDLDPRIKKFKTIGRGLSKLLAKIKYYTGTEALEGFK